MSWKIKKHKNQDKYKVYSTISDQYLNDSFLSKEEVVNFIKKEWTKKMFAQLKAQKEELKTFPVGWTDLETDKIYK